MQCTLDQLQVGVGGEQTGPTTPSHNERNLEQSKGEKKAEDQSPAAAGIASFLKRAENREEAAEKDRKLAEVWKEAGEGVKACSGCAMQLTCPKHLKEKSVAKNWHF